MARHDVMTRFRDFMDSGQFKARHTITATGQAMEVFNDTQAAWSYAYAHVSNDETDPTIQGDPPILLYARLLDAVDWKRTKDLLTQVKGKKR
jgi:hypothetical protein